MIPIHEQQNKAFDIVYYYYKKLRRDPDSHRLSDQFVSSDPILQAKYRGAGHVYEAMTGKKINEILRMLSERFQTELAEDQAAWAKLDKEYPVN